MKDLFEPPRQNELLSFHYKISLQEALNAYLKEGERKCDSPSSSEREENVPGE